MDRDRIERRDFPTGRRGYDPAAVDEHLRRVADEFEARAHPPVPSLAASTSEQVRQILEAAERGAAELRAAAGTEATEHVTRVQEAADGMLTKLDALESELSRLMTVLRTSAERLTEGLADLKSDAATALPPTESKVVRAQPEQLDTRPPADVSPAPPAAGDALAAPAAGVDPAAPAAPTADAPAPNADASPSPTSAAPPADADDSPATAAASAADADRDASPAPDADADAAAPAAADAAPAGADASPAPADASPAPDADAPAAPAGGARARGGHDSPPLSAPDAPDWPVPLADTLFPEEGSPEPEDAGARLIALNMALNGSPRDDTRVFLEEHFDLPDVDALLDDVYARAGR